MKGQQPDRIGSAAEECRMAERDDAGVAEREIERKREQDRDQKLGAEAEIIGKGEIKADGGEPGQRLPPLKTMSPDQDAGRRVNDSLGDGRGLARERPRRSRRFPSKQSLRPP